MKVISCAGSEETIPLSEHTLWINIEHKRAWREGASSIVKQLMAHGHADIVSEVLLDDLLEMAWR
jgi:hypothetical protein